MISITVIIFVLINGVSSARILGVVAVPSYSHQVVFQPLWKELSQRGHQVTVLTTNPLKDSTLTNLTEIDLSHIYQEVQALNINEAFALGSFSFMWKIHNFYINITEGELSHPGVQTLINNRREHFDILLVEGFVPVMYYFAERFRCPFIVILSMEALASHYRIMGNPTSPALYPDVMLPYMEQLTFWQRLESTAFEIFMVLINHFVLAPKHEKLATKYFGEGLSSIEKVTSKTSLLFTNTDSILHQVRPLLPNIIQMGGGTHLKTQKPLPRDLRKKLDSATERGFIYFSFGSNIKSKNLPAEKRRLILQVLAELPQLVLWKFEMEDFSEKPPNVIISKWFSQQDILRHPNIRLFITQGGLQSMEEAIYSHVPMIGIPFMADQPKNVRNMVARGLGLELDINTIDKQNFKQAILEVLENPKYKNAVTKLGQLARDQPMTGLEKAVWWTEYVIRNKGADHLRSPALDVPWYQYFLLDIIAFSMAVTFLTFFMLYKIIKLLIKNFKDLFTPKIKTS